ncbi:hypothetical protein CRUP_015711, partial [Coryphaenoides rupestris]
RLHSNTLNCDCHLSWLAQWLRQRPTIGLFTQCTAPVALRGLNVAEIQKHEFTCSVYSPWLHLTGPGPSGWPLGSLGGTPSIHMPPAPRGPAEKCIRRYTHLER